MALDEMAPEGTGMILMKNLGMATLLVLWVTLLVPCIFQLLGGPHNILGGIGVGIWLIVSIASAWTQIES
jgi:hypothetical protein